MACGCKKNKNTSTQGTVTNINTSIPTPTSQTIKLSEEQQKDVDNIISKLKKIS